MFNKNKNISGFVVQEEFVPQRLQGYSPETEYIPTDYKILSREYKAKFYSAMEDRLKSLTMKMDKHNSGNELHGYIKTQIKHLREDFNQDAAMIEYQAERIINVKQTRCEELEMEKNRIKAEKEENAREMEPLKGYRAQYDMRLFGKTFSVGLVVTIIAMIVDMIANYSYLQGIVTMDSLGFFVVILTMAVMSDCSMAGLGVLLSKADETYMNKSIRNILFVSLIAIFLLSVAAGPMIRFGSMDMQYGTYDSLGNFVPKESGYTLAEFGTTLVTSFLTVATGLLSFFTSYDKNREKAIRYKELKEKNDDIDVRIENIITAQEYIKRSIPIVVSYNAKEKDTAKNELLAMEDGLLARATMLWAEHVGSPETIEKASETIDEITDESITNSDINENYTLKVSEFVG